MVTPVVFLNLFFVPAISLWRYYEMDERPEIAPSLKLLLQYAIFAACNVPLAKVGIFFIKRLLRQEIYIDSGYYTLFAIMAAYALPDLWKKAREFRLKEYSQNDSTIK